MSKSGEILRISHGNYSFLCSHCGFNFHDINEILIHIDFHYEILDNRLTAPDDTNLYHATVSLCDSTATDTSYCDQMNIQKLCLEQIIVTPENIQTEFKIEPGRETKTDANEETTFDIGAIDESNSVDVSPEENRRKKTSASKKVKCRPSDDELLDDEKQLCTMCGCQFGSASGFKAHLRDVHQMLDREYECYICGYKGKSVTALKRHLRGGSHSKSNCYQCESEPVIRNEWDPRPHKCCLCGSWFENHVHFRTHFKDAHDKDVEKFFAKRTNCTDYVCYICQKGFLHKYYLRSHQIIHSELKAYICDVCGKTYRTKAILKVISLPPKK